MKKNYLFIFCLIFLFIAACSSSSDERAANYDPNKTVEFTKFWPDSGGIASKVMIEGSNFGSDTSKIKLYFNEKRAAVINADGNKIYALAPRLPGKECVLTLEVGDQKMVHNDIYRYKEQRIVTTVAGERNANAGVFKEGSLATAAFAAIYGIVADKYGNVFVSMREKTKAVARVDIPGNQVYLAAGVMGGVTDWTCPTIDPETQIVYVPSDNGNVIMELNPVNLWVPKIKRLLHPSAEAIAGGIQDFTNITYKHSLAFNPSDKKIYTRSYQGEIIRFDPKTYVGESLGGIIDNIKNSDGYIAIDPLDNNMIYICYRASHLIRRFNIRERKYEDYAGRVKGWRDGPRLDAEFNSPRQIAFDADGILYVADRENKCVRQISRDGVVSTTTGIPTKWGTADGDPETAGFDNPHGICVDFEGNIFIGEDLNNRMLRKLTLE